MAMSQSSAVVVKGYMYIFQGRSESNTNLNGIYRAALDENGFPGAFSFYGDIPSSVSYRARFSSQAVVLNDVIYILGGAYSTSVISSVIQCPVNSDGSLGTWSNGNSLNVGVSIHRVAATSNKLFIFGGRSSSLVPISTIQVATIDADAGSVGTWSTASVTLPIPLQGGGVVTIGDKLYYIGGETTSSVQSSAIYVSTIDSNGDLSAFSLHGNLPEALSGHQVVATAGAVYVIGGYNKATVYRAPITGTSIGTFAACTALPSVTRNAVAAISSGKLLITAAEISFSASADLYSIDFAGGENDYTGFDVGEYEAPTAGDIVVHEEVDSVSVTVTAPSVAWVIVDEPVDSVSGGFFTNTIFTVIDEPEDSVSISCIVPSVCNITADEECDTVAATGNVASLSNIVVDEPVDSVAGTLGPLVESSACVVEVSERIPDSVSILCENTANLIVVDEEVDEVVISASAPAVCTVRVTEYKDTIAIPTSSTGAPSCYFSIVEAADTVSATAWTPSVAMVSVESGDTIFIEVETSPPIVATVAIKEPVDAISASGIMCVGAIVAVDDPVDDVCLSGYTSNLCMVNVDDCLDRVKITFVHPSPHFEFYGESLSPQTLVDSLASNEALSFSYPTRTSGTVDGQVLVPLHFQR